MTPRIQDSLTWIFFLLVLSALSFFPLAFGIRAALILAGLGIPWLWLVGRQESARAGEMPPYQRDLLSAPGLWMFLLPLVAAIALRFWGITNLLVWPQADEGFSGIAGIELSRKWDWRFFYGDGQSPPVLDWICALFFKTTDSYFFNLWVPPVIFSVLTPLLGYATARQYFPPTVAWLFGGLVAFTYWPLYLGRLCLQVVMFPPWEMAAFWAMGKYLRASHGSKLKSAVLLGFITGLGAYTYVPWVFIPALFAGVLFFQKKFSFREKLRLSTVYVFFLCLGAILFLVACVREGYGDHISNLWAGKPAFTWAGHLLVIADYFNILVWGYLGEVPRYVPFQGGYLNPALGGLFLLGLAEAWRFRREPFAQALAAGLALFLLPGILSTNVQGLRIVPVMPLALCLVVLGFQRLAGWGNLPSRWALAGLVLAGSAALDFHRLLQPYEDPSKYEETFRKIDKNPALYRGYQWLQAKAAAEGPGLLFTDFTPERDQTLRGSTYPFNAAWKRGLRPDHCRWAALLVERETAPLAEQLFPGGQWTGLGGGAGMKYDLVLGWVPLASGNRERLERWSGEVFGYFQGLSSAVNEVKNLATYRQAEAQFLHPPAEVQSDKFLALCLARRTAEFYDHFGRY